MSSTETEGVGTPTPPKVAKLTIEIEGERWSDLEAGLEQIVRLVGEEYLSGADRNETGSYSFDITDHHVLDGDDGPRGWQVRRLATSLQPGQRFIFDEAFGGEGETVTCQGYSHHMGTVSIDVEEFDHPIDVTASTWVTVVSRG